MAQLADDCFAFGGELMRAGEALAILAARVVPVATPETVALDRACGRILAGDVIAERDVPPHDNSAVDGYAVYFDDLATGADTRLVVSGRAAAGHPLAGPAPRGHAVRIFTGAPMPRGEGDAAGPDTVLMQEDCRPDGETVVIPPGIKRGANRRKAGEDIKHGKAVLTQGCRLRAQDIGLAASLGRTTLQVYAPLRVAVFSTGDELREPGEPAPPGKVYDANRHALKALLAGLGCVVSDLGILPDRRELIARALADAVKTNDAIVTSGGMSTGEEDHFRDALTSLGGKLHFWRLAIRPGRPVALGQLGAVPVLGLPGNPVAMMVTFLRFARPVLLRLAGCTATEPRLYRVRADFAYKKKPTRREWVRARLSRGEDGMLVATKFPRDGAGILTSLVESDGLVELAEDLTQVSPGMMVDFLPFTEVS